jgi:branched-chain amino acid transport system permease protein
MEQNVVLQTVINGVMLSVILILFALGLSLVFGIMRIVNFAHGEVYMLGGFGMWWFYAQHDVPYVLSLILTMAMVAGIGMIMEKLFFRKFRGNLLPGMIISVGLIFIMQASVATGWGFLDKAIPTPSVFEGVIHSLGATLSKERLYVILICAAVVVFLYLFLMRTRYGRSMRATAQDPDAAALQGIGVDRTCGIAMGIGAALAAAAGALAGSVFLVNPYMGSFPLLKAFVAIILGGMGSLPGTVIGGFMIGFTESFGSTYLSSTLATMLIFLLLIVTLVIRPTGLFGRAE